MRLVLTIDGSVLEFAPLNDDAPYPFLKSAGDDIEIAARAGSSSSLGANDTPTASATLQNHRRQVAELIGNPMRAKAEIFDGAELAFAGIVASVRYGLDVELKLES